MFKYLLLLGLFCFVQCDESRSRRYDPFSALDRQLSHVLAHHYLWPWSQLFRAAVAVEEEEQLEISQMSVDRKRYEITMSVKRFKPDELKVRVRDRNILIEGKHKSMGDDNSLSSSHFVQSFAMPDGSKEEEITAILKENGVLTIFGPRHNVPLPPPEHEIPIIVQKSAAQRKKEQEEIEKKKKEDNRVEKQETTTVKEATNATSSASPIELDVAEATTHVGKTRKKELKTTTKTAKDNEVTKGGDSNYEFYEAESDE